MICPCIWTGKMIDLILENIKDYKVHTKVYLFIYMALGKSLGELFNLLGS